jgi:tRNA modification GTPase
LTTDARGAIAVVRVWGTAAVDVVDSAFRPNRGVGLSHSPGVGPRFGRIGQGLGDEVVVVVLDGERPEVEVQCHGGPAAVQTVLTALVAAGARRASAGRWATRVSRTSIRAQAEYDLAHAPTLRTAEILLEQAQGALDQEIQAIVDRSTHDPGGASDRLDELLERVDLGLRLLAGWQIVLFGRPNVGKSRLLNALAGYERAIVDATPGTTRDVVSVGTALDGWPVQIDDTAGLRATDDPVESQGVALAQRRREKSDLGILVLDRSEPLRHEDLALLAASSPAIRVANKADLAPAWDASTVAALPVSAERGDGLDELIAAIVARLVPRPPDPGVGVPFRARQVRLLRAARAAMAAGRAERFGRAMTRLISG